MNILIGVILPYVTIIVFIGGIIYHIRTWNSLPAPKMTLTPAPAPGARYMELLKETLFFRSLFKGDKSLWFVGWIFHAMLALVFIGHLRVISWLPDKMLAAMGMTEQNINSMSSLSGGAAGIVIIVMVVILLGRRFITQRVREISAPGDYFTLLLVLLVLVTGDAMRFISAVRQFADNVLACGRDTYGPAHTPLFRLTELPLSSRQKLLVVHYPDV